MTTTAQVHVNPEAPACTRATTFATTLNRLAQNCWDAAARRGFHDEPRHPAVAIALMHAELSEAVEALRSGNGPSEHIPEFDGVSEELADLLIRLLDFSVEFGIDIGAAVEAKMAYNETRPYKHNRKF